MAFVLPDCYTQAELIGRGAYGKVYKAQHRDRSVAIKAVPLDEGIPASVVREVTILQPLRHENVVRLYDVKLTETHVLIEMELMQCDLGDFICAFQCPVKLRRQIMRQVLQGVAHCHSHWIAHRDIKPQNILINPSDGHVCVADFGMARHQGALMVRQQKNVELVTIWYRPPEVLWRRTPYTCQMDLWSVGCVLAEMMLRRPLYREKTEELMQQRITDTHKDNMALLKEMFVLESPIELDLLLNLLQEDPERRISASDALLHVYFQDV